VPFDQKYLIWALIFLAGAWLAPQVRKVPVLGPKLPA
jgi:hypothetical protein